MLPLQGVSAIDAEGKPFADLDARNALFDGVRATCGSIEIVEMNNHINDDEFAVAAATRLLELIGNRKINH